MKVLLINPPAQNTLSEAPSEDGSNYIEPEDFGAFPPLGLLYVATCLEKNTHHTAKIIDCVGENMTHDDLAREIEKYQPDIVGLTSFTISMIDVVLAARTARRIVPRAHICLGGHHSIAFPFEAAQLPEFDSIVVGEGELVFPELCNRIEKNESFEDLVGVYNKEKMLKLQGTKFATDKRFLPNVSVPPAYVDDIRTLPIPDRSHISHIRYHSTVGITGHLATIISSRGCPYLCTFCDVPYKRYRERDAADVVNEIEDCLAKGYTEFHFYDDLFNIKPAKIHRFCEELEKRNLKITWDFRGRVNGVDYDSLVRAKKNGLRLISFGVETGSDEGLKLLKKGSTTAQYIQAFKWCRELGIRTIADFIIGFPFEKTREDIDRNIQYLIDLDPDFCVIGVLMLLPGTPIFDEGVEAKQTSIDKWHAFALDPTGTKFAIEYWTEHFSATELIRMREEAYKKFYLRPGFILRSALNVRSYHEFKSKLRGFLTLLKNPRFIRAPDAPKGAARL
jgi:radical SAM superfamily enzyme YgiQ (UPF0313 family)